MAKAKLDHYAGYWGYLRANPIHQLTSSRLPIDETTWSDAEPSGSSARTFTLKTLYTEPVFGEDDFEMTVELKFIGKFEKTDGAWSGKIQQVKIFDDGDLAAIVKTKGKVDLSDLYGDTYSGVIWDKIALNGLSGRLSGDNDYFKVSSGNDKIFAGAGNDYVAGYNGKDRLFGQGGDDTLVGFNDDDKLFGGAGNDDLKGLEGDDILKGGGGADIFRSEDTLGSDTWTGGRGADTFEVGYFADGGYGATVTDFSLKQGDKISLQSDSAFIFYEIDEIRYIGDAEFSGEAGVYEIRMENGIVEVDSNGGGTSDLGIKLEGHDSFAVGDTSWLLLPDGFDFA